MARKKLENKTDNYGSGASLGREQMLRATGEMRLYKNPVEHEYLVLGLDLNGLGYEA